MNEKTKEEVIKERTNEKNKEAKQFILLGIMRNIVSTTVLFLAIQTIFDIQIKSIPFFVFFSITIGATNYFMKEIQIFYHTEKYYKNITPISECLLVLEKTISKLQKLLTDEDLILKSKKELDNEVNELIEKFNMKP